MKKIISVMLSFIVLITSVCVMDLTAFARNDEDFTYTYDDKTSTLVIKGKGEMESRTYTAEYAVDEMSPEYEIFSKAKKVIISEGITGIGYDCFGFLSEVEEISFPSTLKYIKGKDEYFGGFYGLKYLKKVTFKNGIEEINCIFENCPSLKNITLPSTLETLYICNWNGITSLTIPSSVKNCYIENCENLQTVTVSAGSALEVSKDSSFISECPNLKSLYVYSLNMSFGKNATLYGPNCKNAVTYCYQGSAVYNNCKNNNRKIKVISEPKNILPCVTGLKATGSDTKQIDLTWNKVSGATGYYVDIMKNGKYVRYGSTTSNKISVKGLNSFQEYTFRVKAYKKVSGTTYYGKYWVGVTYGTRAARISNFRATGSNNGTIYLAWNKNARATGYKVFKYDTAKKSYVLYKDIKGANNTKLSVTGLKNNTKYQFKIYAYYKGKTATYNGYCSNAISASTKLNMVTMNSVTSKSSKRITVNWNKAWYSCTGYQVMWSTAKNFSTNCQSVYVKGQSTLSTTLKTAQSGRNYYVRTRVYTEKNNKKTYGSWSAVKTVKVK